MRNKVTNWLTITVATLTAAIALGAFVLSYDALYAIGQEYGVKSSIAWVWPLLIDLPLIVFTLALLVAQISQNSVKLWAALVGLYTLATIAFNIAHAQQSPLGWLVAVVAPVGLLLSTEALRHLAKNIIERQSAIDSLRQLNSQLDAGRKELNTIAAQVDAKQREYDTVQAQLEALNIGKNQGNVTPDIGKLNAGKSNAKQQRLNTLLDYFDNHPQATLTDAAQVVDVTRQTVSRYVTELETAGALHRNGSGWEVTL